MSSQIRALLTEREGYVRRGLTDRVRQVDDALAALGHVETVRESASVEPETERATVRRPTRRKG